MPLNPLAAMPVELPSHAGTVARMHRQPVDRAGRSPRVRRVPAGKVTRGVWLARDSRCPIPGVKGCCSFNLPLMRSPTLIWPFEAIAEPICYCPRFPGRRTQRSSYRLACDSRRTGGRLDPICCPEPNARKRAAELSTVMRRPCRNIWVDRIRIAPAAALRLAPALSRDKPGNLQRPGIEGRGCPTPERAMMGIDQAVGKVGGRVFPDE